MQGSRDAGRRLHRAQIWAGAGGLFILSDEADQMATGCRRRAFSHYMVETAPGCWAIMPRIMPRGSCSRRESHQYIG
nr:MAG TPA: hypothetical protein [Caudoviricetes sp.]